MYLVRRCLFFLVGGMMALVIRLQLEHPDGKQLSPEPTTSSSPCTGRR